MSPPPHPLLAVHPAALLAAAALILLLARRQRRSRGASGPVSSPSRRGRMSRGPSGRVPSGQLPLASADPASQGLLPFGSERSARLARESSEGLSGGLVVGTPRFWGAASPRSDRCVPPGRVQGLSRRPVGCGASQVLAAPL